MTELVDGLAQASNPYRRLAAAFDLNALVERKRARLDADYEVYASAVREEIAETSQLLEMQQRAASVAREAKERTEALQRQLEGDGLLKRFEAVIHCSFSETVGSVTKKTVAAVRRRADEHMDVLIHAWRTIRFDGLTEPSTNGTGGDDLPWLDAVMEARPVSPPDVEEAYADLVNVLRQHKLADYYPWVPGSSFEEDCALLSASGQHAQRIAKSASMAWVKSGLKAARESAKHADEKATRTVNAVKADVERLRRLRLELDDRLALRDRDYRKACEGMRGSIEQSRVFRQRMTEGHRLRDEELIDEIREEGDVSRRFFLLALRELHQREFPQALEGSFA
jgi:cell division septum initiation protein DivIVA